jgi:hypothetical protein
MPGITQPPRSIPGAIVCDRERGGGVAFQPGTVGDPGGQQRCWEGDADFAERGLDFGLVEKG